MASYKNKCQSCDYCKSLYLMYGFRFWRSKRYFCARQNKPISVYDGCDTWQAKKQRYDLSAQRLDEVEDDINALLLENTICD
ncbi:MAG: hypothetical protein K2I75_03820 [Clostridiales bacterium]|nr:hypothetical protein [Clostridiales bacterium]